MVPAGGSGLPAATWRCRWCRSGDGDVVLDLGDQPAADHFPEPDDPPDATYPLRMVLCRECGLAQLEEDLTQAEEPRGVEPAALVSQGRAAVADLLTAGLLRSGARVDEAPSPHGGSWLDGVRDAGGVPVDDGPVDLLVDSFGMMHEADQRAAWEARAARLADGGVLTVHVHTLATILRDGTWNALRHGHYAYYSVPVLVRMASAVGLAPVGAWTYGLYGGTVMVAFTHEDLRIMVPEEPSRTLARLLDRETTLGVEDVGTVAGLQTDLTANLLALREWFADNRGSKLAAYGAASRAVAVLHLAGVSSTDLVAIADVSPIKHGRAMPGSRVPIVAPQDLAEAAPDRVLLFVSDLLDEARVAVPEIEMAGGRWVVAERSLRMVQSVAPET